MQIFGQQNRVAVQAEVIDRTDRYVFAHICLWADNNRIGDDRQTVLLAPVVDFFRGTLLHPNRNIAPELAALSPEQVVKTVQSLLEDSPSSATLLREADLRRAQTYAQLCICPNGCEAFDGELAVLLEKNGTPVFIWRSFADKQTRELRLARGEYERAVEEFLLWGDLQTGRDPLTEHFARKSFVLLGSFSEPQSEIAKTIRRLGGRVEPTVSERTSYVLLGQAEPAPGELAHARSLNIPVLTEAEFKKLLPSR